MPLYHISFQVTLTSLFGKIIQIFKLRVEII